MVEALATRMKLNYELRQRPSLIKRVPVILRVDGRAFHTFTASFERPFSKRIIAAMVAAARNVAKEMSGTKAVYIQSDEASFLLTDYDKLQTQPWFEYNQQKLTSIAAALMSVHFNAEINCEPPAKAVFDARAFNVPREEVANYFLWRMQDWKRNSLQMFAGAFFSHAQLMNKNEADKHEMLHDIGENWASLQDQEKNGTWLLYDPIASSWDAVTDILPRYSDIATQLEPLINCDQHFSTQE